MEKQTPLTTLPAQLADVQNQFPIPHCAKISIHYRKDRVTAACSAYHRKFGSRGATLQEALYALAQNVQQHLQWCRENNIPITVC